jgi:hypothetical protein
MDRYLRIEIVMLELAYVENFTIFGHSERELRCFENFIFRNYIRLTGILICVTFVGHPYCGSVACVAGGIRGHEKLEIPPAQKLHILSSRQLGAGAF